MANSNSEIERGFAVYECGCKDEIVKDEVYIPFSTCPEHEKAVIVDWEDIADRLVAFHGNDGALTFRVTPMDWYRFLCSDRADEMRREQREYDDREIEPFADVWWQGAARMLASEMCQDEDTPIRSFGHLEARSVREFKQYACQDCGERFSDASAVVECPNCWSKNEFIEEVDK